LRYQWRFNGREMAGATNASLVPPTPGTADVGTYDVVVSSATGSTISAPVRLTLVDIAVLPVVRIDGVVGQQYRIEFQTDIETTWNPLDEVTLTTSPFYYLDLSGRTEHHRFYRVRPVQ